MIHLIWNTTRTVNESVVSNYMCVPVIDNSGNRASRKRASGKRASENRASGK